MYQVRNVEELADVFDEYKEPIKRWLAGDMRPEDRDVMIEIVDNALPDDQILWPPWVVINVEDGHITLTAHVMEITTSA